MRIQKLPLTKINPAPYNPRTISDDAMARLERSIKEFDLVEPLVVNKRTGYTLIGGHQRLKVLQKAARKEAECVIVDLTPGKEKALNVALNNQKMAGEYDFPKLADLLAEIDTGEFDVGALTGFSQEELEQIASYSPNGEREETDPVPEPPAEAKSKTGDIWEMGRHRLLCGDSTREPEVANLMGGERAVLMNTDPPYGVDYGDIANSRERAADKRKGGSGRVKRTSAIRNDDLSGERLQKFLEDCIRASLPHLIENPAFYLWHPMLTQGTFFAAAAAADILIHRQIVWVKPSLIMGRGDYHWRHELCFYGWIRGKRCDWLAGRDQHTFWEIGRENDKIHPTQKPVELFLRPMKNHTLKESICYEPFSGSGSQVIAAEMIGRRCFAIEIEPRYVDVCVKRWQNYTKKKAKNLTRPDVEIE